MAAPSTGLQASSKTRVCFTLRVRPDRMDEYRERHAAVWPEMLRALADTGWSNYSLFLGDDGLLVGYLETDDFDAARAGMARREVNARWQAEMAPFFEGTDGANADDAFNVLTEVFNLETQLAATTAEGGAE
ncbi:L-rhamnose mutarotase [Glycomyces sp. TRM65418]|uniref:L-rhamnose mutarotase n=1 Tax=Glycomyces sp. TRM65418 TaxID=2867006 RepID=UPI001CE6D8D8|nr:L-rhamnose mutarotase [Glycomyces sp. TRM65418]MCC3763193.1 L-rhamnose mutarotase [Glycomyces sp. TRM65418]QZD57197.1 L-rhamnose mutarotase [Glycomyces sp. TRM65418]